jgi:hypothetical protein
MQYWTWNIDFHLAHTYNRKDSNEYTFLNYFIIFLAFYFPDSETSSDLKKLIEKNGGRTTDQHECFTFQLKPEKSKTDFSYFFKGAIYSAKWILESVDEGKLLKRDDYFICINIDERSKKLNLGRKKKYTIIEGVMLFELITS